MFQLSSTLKLANSRAARRNLNADVSDKLRYASVRPILALKDYKSQVKSNLQCRSGCKEVMRQTC